MNAVIPLAKGEAGASPGAAAVLEDLTDACVMESYFREHMTERDPLFHDTVAPHLAAYAPAASAAQQRDYLTHNHQTPNAPATPSATASSPPHRRQLRPPRHLQSGGQSMKPFDLIILRQAMAAGNIEWRKHVLQKLAERGIPQDSVREVLLRGERIRAYAGDKPFPSALFLGYVSGKPLHVVAACDETNRQVYIITAYEPSLEIFEGDYRTKRKP